MNHDEQFNKCVRCGAEDPFMAEMKISLRGSEFHYQLCEPCGAHMMEEV